MINKNRLEKDKNVVLGKTKGESVGAVCLCTCMQTCLTDAHVGVSVGHLPLSLSALFHFILTQEPGLRDRGARWSGQTG